MKTLTSGGVSRDRLLAAARRTASRVAKAVPGLDAAARRIRHSPRYFERLYSADDPYGLVGNTYEQAKYDDLLGALEDRRYASALEVGCSIGLFTEQLAPRCDALLAVDIAERAVAQTRARLRDVPSVRVEQASLPDDLPAGRFDLIVCSDVLYHLPPKRLTAALDVLADRLLPGGSLLALHWLGDHGAPTSGERVHELLGESLVGFSHARSERRVGVGTDGAGYRLDRYDRPAG